jgi:hypothetical protein
MENKEQHQPTIDLIGFSKENEIAYIKYTVALLVNGKIEVWPMIAYYELTEAEVKEKATQQYLSDLKLQREINQTIDSL